VDEAAFRAPPAEFGPLAMWFLNGRPADDELRRQIGAMAAGHVGSVQIAARTGLETPYLSERWFQAVELIQDASDGLLDAMYVLGDFGVFFDDAGSAALGDYPSVLRWSERWAAG
jgi:hypothetical protein